MASKQLENSFASAIKNISATFAEAEKAIRRSKAAIRSAEYRLQASKKEVQQIVDSLKNDINIELELAENNSIDMFLACDDAETKGANLDDSGMIDCDEDSSGDVLKDI